MLKIWFDFWGNNFDRFQPSTAVKITISISPMTKQITTAAMIRHYFMLASEPSSRFYIHSRVRFLSERDVFSVLTLKFFIWGTCILLYSAWVSKKSGRCTHLTKRSRPCIGISSSSLPELLEEFSLELELLSDSYVIGINSLLVIAADYRFFRLWLRRLTG